jgi:pyocin large subunit-like protein
MSGTRIVLFAAAAALLLSACDNGPSAVAERPDAGARDRAIETARGDGAGGEEFAGNRAAERNAAAPEVNGRPMWSATRRYSAEENARRAFERNGQTFGATDVDAFVEKAHAFVHNPPRGTLTLDRRNGDTLLYDPKGNVFAIRTAEGAPRTMFKPDDGMAYWEEQKTREARRSAGRGAGDDDA